MNDRADITRDTLRRLKACVVIPTYNNAGTLGGVVAGVARYADNIIVVNDGSSDNTAELLANLPEQPVTVDYSKNRGKGYALKRGFMKAKEMGFRYAVTIDSDGQHYPDDLPLFAETATLHPDTLVTGCRGLDHDNMPGKSKFANRFANFWFWAQTGVRLSDTQTGYRLYPLNRLHGLRLLSSRYEAELELLVFAVWHGVDVLEIPVKVYYPPKEERVSHFRPATDFARISLLNTILCVAAAFYGFPLKIYNRARRKS